MTAAPKASIDLTSLIGSRICHDLISPLGAIGNGVELLAMSGVAAGPEMSLIAESVENANARIRFFRIAFGAAAPDAMLGRSEILEVLGGLAKGGRQSIQWQIEAPLERRLVKLAFLCLQCLESALPWGGRIVVQTAPAAWTLTAEAGKIRDLDPLWEVFDDRGLPHQLTPADIQFALAPTWAADIGWVLSRSATPTRLELGFRPA
jgi:histidine phosphotransferase ChpT